MSGYDGRPSHLNFSQGTTIPTIMAPADNGYFYKNSPCSLRAILSQLSFTSEPLLKDGSVNRGDTKKSSFLWNGLFCSPWDGDLYFDAMESFDGSDVKGPVLPPIATDKGLLNNGFKTS